MKTHILGVFLICFCMLTGCGPKYELEWFEIPAGTLADGTPYPRFWISNVITPEMHEVCVSAGECKDYGDDDHKSIHGMRISAEFCSWADSWTAFPWQKELSSVNYVVSSSNEYEKILAAHPCTIQCRTSKDCQSSAASCVNHLCLRNCPDGSIDDGRVGCVPEWIEIPGGSFTLSHETAEYFEGMTPKISAFLLQKFPVTVEQFRKCVEAGPCANSGMEKFTTGAGDNSHCSWDQKGDAWARHPMDCVDWYKAKRYCEWAGGRLPTEEEWEYAATHNGMEHLNTTYPWGNSAPTSLRANFRDGGENSTTAVGAYSPAGDSPLGLVDMGGNVQGVDKF